MRWIVFFAPILASYGMTGLASSQTAAVPYESDFESGYGNEWSNVTKGSHSELGSFMGPYGDAVGGRGKGRLPSTTLTVETTRGVEYAVVFDLFLFDHWEGTRRNDRFQVRVGGKDIFSHRFSYAHDNETFDQSAMWLDRFEDIAYDKRRDIVMRQVTTRFTATGTREQIEFSAALRRDGTDESWGIDNVQVIPASILKEVESPLVVSWLDGHREHRSVENLNFTLFDLQTNQRQIAWLPTRSTVHPDLGTDRVAMRVFGGLVIPESGNWQFRLSSDDGSTMRLNGELLVNNDGRHSYRSRTASTSLKEGVHTIDVRCFEWGGAVSLIFEWKGPSDKNWSVVPPSAFTTAESTDIALTNVTTETGLDNAKIRYAMTQAWNDFNNDGYLDLIIGGYYGSVQLGTSRGQFLQVQDSMLLYYQSSMADIDNDGDIDLVSAYRGVQRNNGNGRFSVEGYPGAGMSWSVSSGVPDLDGDGRNDLTTSYGYTPIFAQGSVTEDGDLAFDRSALSSLMSGVLGTWRYGTYLDADFNNDGKPDVLRSGGFEGVWLATNADDQFALTQLTTPIQRVNFVYSNSTAADFDNDGDLDIFNGTHYLGQGNGMLINDGSGGFTADPTIVPDSQTMRWSGAEFGDVDNDGDLDMLLRSFYSSRVELRLNDGHGNFGSAQILSTSIRYPSDARFVDFDNDGDLDMSIVGYYEVALIRNDTDNASFLKVRVTGAGLGGTNASAVGTRVELLDAETGEFVARRDITSTSGIGAGPFWLHFGGVEETREYIVRVHYLSGSVDYPVTPVFAKTEIGSVTVPQMISVEEYIGGSRRVITWRTTDQRSTILAALEAEARRRGLRSQLQILHQNNQLSVKNLLSLLDARSVRDALGDRAAVLADLTHDPHGPDD